MIKTCSKKGQLEKIENPLTLAVYMIVQVSVMLPPI